MSLPLGAIAYSAPATNGNASFRSQKSKKATKPTSSSDSYSFGLTSFQKAASPTKATSPRKNSLALSSRSWVSRTKEHSKNVSVPEPAQVPALRPLSLATDSHHSSPHDSFDLPYSSFITRSFARPKHVPILIPDQYSYVPSESGSSFSFGPYSSSGSASPVSVQLPSTASSEPRPLSARSVPRHVEIKIPRFANPDLKHRWQAFTPPVKEIIRSDSFTELSKPSPPVMSQPTPESSRTNTMDSQTSRPSPDELYPDRAKNDSTSNLSSYSSQTSLTDMPSDYESASETESTTADEATGSSTPSADVGGSNNPSQTPGSNPANLSGLVCNVHRTTGKEPHPLVGATTTILGDKLYVFGGRRLSRTRPQMTANLYELDLIRRHWTKLETSGDIPPPRYFHSVCALGDTKLVCYGGMSPTPAFESGAEAQPEVSVMSDVHIYDVPSQTWTKVNTPDSPQGRYAHCAAILPTSAVFASQNAPMSAVHHNPAGAEPNQGSLGVSLDGTGGAEMVVVGGQDSANHYIEQVSIFNLRSLKWTGTTGMGRSCGAYRSVVTPLTSMSASQIGGGPHDQPDADDEDEEPATIGSGAPMLIYSNYNFLDVKLELQVRLTDGTLTEKPMQTVVSPPGLRFPNGGIIDNHFVVSGTFLTSSKQEYALWALDLRTLVWSRIDAGGSIFSQGSWNRGVLWSRRNSFVILGHRKRSLVEDYNNRRINFTNICVVELEAFGLYENPRTAEPNSGFVSASGSVMQISKDPNEDTAFGRLLSSAAEDIGALALNVRELADMDFLAIDGTRVPVNSRLISRRWGPHFITLLRESLAAAADTDTATLRPNVAGHPSRNSSITITPSVNSVATTLTNNSTGELPDTRTAPPSTRPRLLYLPHTAPTLHALLHYLYTSTLPAPNHPLATPQIFCSLLQLARPYQIDGLLEATVERLHQCLDGRNAAAIFNAAAMGAGGGDSVQFTSSNRTIRESDIPVRIASLAGLEGLLSNGGNRASALRIDTGMANGRNPRHTLRPGQASAAEESDEDMPQSATTDASTSENEMTNSFTGRGEKQQAVWKGTMSSVVGLQKRGLRGLMEGRRMRERGREAVEGTRVGLGIA